MASDVFTVLVVCTGNLNRSALGAALLDTWVKWYLPASMRENVNVTSAGLEAPVGRRMNRRAQAVAAALGADGSAHRAAQLTEQDVRGADLVLVSSSIQRDKVLALVPAALRSTFTIREAGRIAESLPVADAPGSIDEMRERVSSIALNRSVAASGTGEGVGGDDIIDPQGKDDEAYRLMAQQEVPPLARIASALFGMPPTEILAYDTAAEAAVFTFEGEAHDSLDDTRTRPRGRREA